VCVTLFAKPSRPMHGFCSSSAVQVRGHQVPSRPHYHPSHTHARVPFGTAGQPAHG
jgi:hypothetical protein